MSCIRDVFLNAFLKEVEFTDNRAVVEPVVEGRIDMIIAEDYNRFSGIDLEDARRDMLILSTIRSTK